MANIVDPDQMSHSTTSDLDLHCLLRSVCQYNEGMSLLGILDWKYISIKHFVHPMKPCRTQIYPALQTV